MNRFSSSSTSIPGTFLDTCVVSGYVNRDMKDEDQAAFETILDLVADSRITVYGSTILRRELDAIPASYRTAHDAEYNKLRILRSATTWLDDDEIGIAPNRAPASEVSTRLHSALPDATDAQLVLLSARYGLPFLTVDYRTILNREEEIRRICGVRVCNPPTFLSSVSSSFSSY